MIQALYNNVILKTLAVQWLESALPMQGAQV